jgi:hypothetical protein
VTGFCPYKATNAAKMADASSTARTGKAKASWAAVTGGLDDTGSIPEIEDKSAS